MVDGLGDRVTWTYDKTYQLLSEDRSGASGYTHTFTYDPVGNRLTKDDGTAVTTYVYDDANRLETAEDGSGVTTHTFDANGNERSIEKPSGDLTTYTWDYENQMSSAEDPAGDVTTYVYTAAEQRVEKETDAETVKFLWDGQNIVQEYDELDVTHVDYTNDPRPAPQPFGNLISQHRDAASSFYHYDALGSTRALTDSSEVETDDYVYEAFGNVAAGTGSTTNPFQWVGEKGYYADEETSLYSLRRRQYASDDGRFVSEDPLAQAGAVTGDTDDSFGDSDREGIDSNLYRYVANNSPNDTDPSGLIPNLRGGLRGIIRREKLRWEFTKGFLYGVVVDGAWGTVTGVFDLLGYAYDLVKWRAKVAWDAVQDPVGYAEDVMAFHEQMLATGQSAAVESAEVMELMQDLSGEIGRLSVEDPKTLEKLLTGQTAGLEGKTSDTLILISSVASELLGSVVGAIANELRTMTAEEAAYVTGRILGVVFFEIVAAIFSGGGSTAAKAAKAGKAAKLTRLIRRLESIDAPILRNRRVQRSLTNLAEFIAWLTNTKICFVAGTPVHTIDGLKNIEDVRCGDRVLTRPDDASDPHLAPIYKRVRFTTRTNPDRLYHVTYVCSDGRQETLTTTVGHRFFIAERSDWVEAQHLADGETLCLAEGQTAAVQEVRIEAAAPGESLTTYNFEVEETHTYFVGRAGVWTHNTSRTTCMTLAANYRSRIQNGVDPGDAFAALTREVEDLVAAGKMTTKDADLHLSHAIDEIGPNADKAALLAEANVSTKFSGSSKVHPRLPERTGTKTQGVFEFDSTEVQRESGRSGPGEWINENLRGGKGSGKTAAWTHVEGHAAGIIRKHGIKEAHLYINYIGGPCTVPPARCQSVIHKLIPPGSKLWVHYPKPDGNVGKGFFKYGLEGFQIVD
ncbi:MAG: hypothetical protein DWQ34_04035 [Planctomycetota bacterium]|nr:MAG: hypothetical protein DWQ34_04035 [Planctomycetota bacterium]REK29685.1 MAG: hypothetical protein DWQ41_03340 [Planctomycetota bacterium]REK30494.1 MAG: hypothetical protein DWQ45_21695 [Planctomycetota bacterium]